MRLAFPSAFCDCRPASAEDEQLFSRVLLDWVRDSVIAHADLQSLGGVRRDYADLSKCCCVVLGVRSAVPTKPVHLWDNRFVVGSAEGEGLGAKSWTWQGRRSWVLRGKVKMERGGFQRK